eukprot:5341760-Pyramimonas_sp.AAC.1
MLNMRRLSCHFRLRHPRNAGLTHAQIRGVLACFACGILSSLGSEIPPTRLSVLATLVSEMP